MRNFFRSLMPVAQAISLFDVILKNELDIFLKPLATCARTPKVPGLIK